MLVLYGLPRSLLHIASAVLSVLRVLLCALLLSSLRVVCRAEEEREREEEEAHVYMHMHTYTYIHVSCGGRAVEVVVEWVGNNEKKQRHNKRV